LKKESLNSGHRWYLVDATLPAVEGGVSAWAVWGLEGRLRESLPVTLKGRILQVVRAPAGYGAPDIQVEGSGGVIAPAKASVRPLSLARAAWMIFRRVAVTCYRLPRKRRLELGLGLTSVVTRPWFAYQQIGRLRAFYPPLSYKTWVDECEALLRQSVGRRRKSILRKCGPVRLRPLIDLRFGWEPEQLSLVVDSVIGQSFAVGLPVAFLLPANKSAMEELGKGFPEAEQISDRDVANWLARLDDDWVLWLTPHSVLADWALDWVIPALFRRPEVDFLYSDHDELTASCIRVRPCFKPDWSLELARCSGYPGDVLVVKRSRLQALAEARTLPSAYGVSLDLGSSAVARVAHLPVVLWHRIGGGELVKTDELCQHLEPLGLNASVEQDSRGFPRIRYPLPDECPRVSVIIPTRNMLHFLKPCVDSLLDQTNWPDLEVLVVDNQSDCPDTLRYLAAIEADARVRVLRYDHPFNFSAINNFAAEHASGEVLCLLNNDTEVIQPGWLREMVSRLMQPGVGVVGARLYFSDGRLQHAGDVLGPGGCAAHLHGVIAGDDPGYMNRAVLPQDLSAVTAACLVTRKDLYQSLGGLDAANLSVAFNDVDYCLRVREKGWAVLFTPYAELYHHESVSRGKDDNAEKAARAAREADYMRQRWWSVIDSDPFYNPNLNFAQPDFQLGRFPRVTYPW
tara:strand:+ start:31927 stop:33978 length:2052 start_codon:yes stop_codon:yes gene_type:complete